MSSVEQPLSWIDAAKALSVNPLLLLTCPSNADDKLVVFDVNYNEEYVDRYLICPTCHSKNIITLKFSKDMARPKIVLDSRDYDNRLMNEIITKSIN